MAEVIPRQLYYRIFAALLVLTLLTWGVAYIDLGGRLNIIVAITIAVSKAALVVLFFMHVYYSSRLLWVFVGAGVGWFMHFMILTLSDYLTREWLR